jgi:hypothetical protein
VRFRLPWIRPSADQASPPPARAVLSAFHPTWPRAWVALAVAIGGFLLPQEVPLVWYPLNEPGDDILYLEIKCRADGDGDVAIYQNLTRGINELDRIYWPISATDRAYTYTFPLPDAPIVELRIDPPSRGVSLHVENLRIIDRRGTEIRRFTHDMLVPVHQIASITPEPNGWRITSTAEAEDPHARIELWVPILAEGMTGRNLLRSLLSTGYLALMLWIILLAVLFACWRPTRWRDVAAPVAFMAFLALSFAPVGNRGLIRNSWHYAGFTLPAPDDERRLEIDLQVNNPTTTQLFWDVGAGINEEDSQRAHHQGHPNLQTLRFTLPAGPVQALRYDPLDLPGEVRIQGIRVVDWSSRTLTVLPLDSFEIGRQIAGLERSADRLVVTTTPDADDPILYFNSDALAEINRHLGR